MRVDENGKYIDIFYFKEMARKALQAYLKARREKQDYKLNRGNYGQ